MEPLEGIDEQPTGETPEDVAILYSWANLQGAKYRDFSANRREYRAQMRRQAAEQLRLMELRAKTEAEEAAAHAEEVAATAHAEADAATEELAASRSVATAGPEEIRREREVERSRDASLREAAEQARLAATERLEAARRGEAAALAESIARREEREIAEAQASALRQAAQYHEAELRNRGSRVQQREEQVPGQISDPYSPQILPEGEYYVGPGTPPSELEASRFRTQRDYIERSTGRVLPQFKMPPSFDEGRRPHRAEVEVVSRIPEVTSDELSRDDLSIEDGGIEGVEPKTFGAPARSAGARTSGSWLREIAAKESEGNPVGGMAWAAEAEAPGQREATIAGGIARGISAERPAPQWLYPEESEVSVAEPVGVEPTVVGSVARESEVASTGDGKHESGGNTQVFQGQVASRWFALRGVFARKDGPGAVEGVAAQETASVPMMAVYSLAGGVGKTNLVATLGRVLSSMGEKVLLVDATSRGLLPLYFGAGEGVSGVVRTFMPPSGSADAPIKVISYAFDQNGQSSPDGAAQATLVDELAMTQQVHRVLLDVHGGGVRLIEGLARLKPIVLVPLAADIGSIVSLKAVEKRFSGMQSAVGEPIQPVYLLNQFDASRPLHVDLREMLRQRLGDRLLPFVIRRTAGVSEALAEGMTIVDYDANSCAAQDFQVLAEWIRSASAPAAAGLHGLRWSEQ
jgi:cellulose synthase operon protein YhjQ